MSGYMPAHEPAGFAPLVCDQRVRQNLAGRGPAANQNDFQAIVAWAFRNGPIEDIHAGRLCPTCTGDTG
jgi:hypothetical protein